MAAPGLQAGEHEAFEGGGHTLPTETRETILHEEQMALYSEAALIDPEGLGFVEYRACWARMEVSGTLGKGGRPRDQ